MAALIRSDGSQKDAGLKAGRNRVLHNSRGFRELLNYGNADLKITVPAPEISPPKTDSDPDW